MYGKKKGSTTGRAPKGNMSGKGKSTKGAGMSHPSNKKKGMK